MTNLTAVKTIYPDISDSTTKKFDPKEMIQAMIELNIAKQRRNAAKQAHDDFLADSQHFQILARNKESSEAEHREAKQKVIELVQLLVRDNPETEPSDVKSEYNGISFRRARELSYGDGISTSKGKTILHEWLKDNAQLDDDGYYILNHNGDKVYIPVSPVIKLTPTLPSAYK